MAGGFRRALARKHHQTGDFASRVWSRAHGPAAPPPSQGGSVGPARETC